MINLREIFNSTYSIIGLIIITILILLILFLNKNIIQSFKDIGITLVIAGIISLGILYIINYIINEIIPYEYKIFTDVIRKNLEKNFTYYAIISIIIGILMVTSSIIINKYKHIKTQKTQNML